MDSLSRRLSEFFDALSDETRLKILANLIERPLNVNEIFRRIPEKSLQTISYQLGLLYRVKLVDYDKQGREKYFKLADMHVVHILKDAITHLKGDQPCENNEEHNNYAIIKEVIEK